MKLVPSRPVRRLLAGLTPIVLVAAALPLLAPTCGTFTPGVKSFSRMSLIIPMDVCYQCTTDGDGNTSPSGCGSTSYVTPTGAPFTGGIACPQATDAGDVVKAYGLVYQLIRNGVAVYWIIDPAKNKLDAEDFHVSYSGGPPALFYDWANGNTGAAVTSQATASYRGGPFVVDGSDYAKASLVLQQYKATFQSVNVHVANVAFEAPVARTMAGGWNAGGAVPPKLAMLDIGSSGAGTKNSEVVIRGYLIKAGLDFVGAGGTSAAGQHGQIYDRLTMADFLPSTPGDWTTTKLYQNGYQILWVPHWTAPSSCSDCTTSASTGTGTCPTTSCACTNTYSPADIATSLKTIGSFNAAGKDVFAECAGLGSFEGVNTGTPPAITGTNATYGLGDATTHFHTVEATPLTGGVWINKSVTSTATYQGGFASPFMQIGDFVFRPYTGAVQNFRPTAYEADVSRFLSETGDTSYDIFTVVPAQAGSHGTSVYLGGHSYSGCDGTYQTAGTRLVMNSLFNLGASCVESGVTCSTGEMGICGRGAMTCSGDTAICARVADPTAELCNGLDDDCNGLVDDLPPQTCYDGPAPTMNVGLCREGVRSCVKLTESPATYGFSACQGQQLPATEVCNGLDDDCDATADEALSQVCYLGPAESLDPVSGLPMGECRTGTQSCSNGNWGYCLGQVTPLAEDCGDAGAGNGADENCNGQLDEICGCTTGNTQYCYGGPAGTAGVGPCLGGQQTCTANAWSSCVGQTVPVAEICGNAIDDDCNGTTDDPVICNVCPVTPQSCYEGPVGTLGVGVCAAGERTCVAGTFGSCGGIVGTTIFDPQILPSQEVCDGKDNDCDGTADEGPPACATGYSCVNGFCVSGYCDPAEPAYIEGYTCDPATSQYVLSGCGTGAACAAGFQCLDGNCIDPCASISCGIGAVCGGGQCTGGSCYSEGCGSGLVCKNGSCVADACLDVFCPSGTFCREGDCVQACTFVSCVQGQRCGIDGFCEADACQGVSCASGKICKDGGCVTNPCSGISCGAGQLCQDGACVDDPCANIECPVGVCYRGQCFSTANPTGGGTIAPKEDEPGGCGCATGAPTPVALLFGLLAIPLARRRREPRGGSGLLGLVLVAGLATTLAGCPAPEEKAGPIDLQTDEANCGVLGFACAAGEVCVDGECGSIVAPYISSVSPPSAAKGTVAPVAVTITGERFEAGAELRVITPTATIVVPATFTDAQHLTATLDVSTAPTGILYLRVRNPDLVRSNAKPFDIVLETPVVSAIAPLTAEAGSVVTLHATGTGLNATSQCHVSGTNYADTGLDSVLAAGGLDCTLVTAEMPPGSYLVWVRNEGNLNSRTFSLQVTSSTSMSVTSLSPSSAVGGVGTFINGLTVYGTGFDSTCRVYFELAPQSTTYLDPTALYVAQVPLSVSGVAYPDGTHPVTVRCGTVTSNILDFTIANTVPVVSTVSPQTAYQGETGKVVTFTGTNLPANSVAQIRKLDGTFVDLTTAFVSPNVQGTLNLTPVANWPDSDLYQVRLRYPSDGTTSVTFPFRILSNAATLRAVAPAGGKAGETIASLAVTGANFFSGIQFWLRTSAGVNVVQVPVLTSPAMTPTAASIGPLALTSKETGLYQLVALNTGSGASNALSFSITPGLPSIVSRTPVSAAQSNTPVTVTITGTNFARPDADGNGGSQLVAWNAGTLSDGVTPIIDPATPVNVATLPGCTVTVVDNDTITVTLDTRSVLASTSPYSIQVWNPGGSGTPQKSGTTTFTVSP